jgi:hypothetical protein
VQVKEVEDQVPVIVQNRQIHQKQAHGQKKGTTSAQSQDLQVFQYYNSKSVLSAGVVPCPSTFRFLGEFKCF